MKPDQAAIATLLEGSNYLADPALCTALFLAISLEKPLLVEGPAGAGKTDLAKVMAQVLDTDLIRLQCYEGLDANSALFEWDYARQLIRIRQDEAAGRSGPGAETNVFSEPFLLKRPLLDAITRPDRPPVLLIDEVDRADEEFEALMLEVFAEFQVTVPELGTVRASHRPYIVLTANGTRPLSDALRRRCLYHWIDYPNQETETRILERKVPGIQPEMAEEVARFMAHVRRMALEKVPGVAESLDWARALMLLNISQLDPDAVKATLACIAKTSRDRQQIESLPLSQLLSC